MDDLFFSRGLLDGFFFLHASGKEKRKRNIRRGVYFFDRCRKKSKEGFFFLSLVVVTATLCGPRPSQPMRTNVPKVMKVEESVLFPTSHAKRFRSEWSEERTVMVIVMVMVAIRVVGGQGQSVSKQWEERRA